MAVKVQKLSKRNRNGWSFRDIDFETGFGETFCIFGPSCSGKTAILRVVSGKDRADGGSVRLGDAIADSSAFFPDSFMVRPSGLIGRITGEYVSETAENRLKRLEETLGDQNARLILLDEPFVGLDIFGKSNLAKLIHKATGRGAAVILTANDFQDVCRVADRVLVLSGGYSRQLGTPREIYENPESSFIASLAGPINLIEARRLTNSKADMPEFITIAGEHRLFAQKTDLRRLGAINSNIKLGIRPEQIALSFGAAFPEDNLLKGRITNTSYFGHSTLVELDCGGLNLTASVPRLVGISAGDECMVGLPPERIRVFAS